MAKTVVEEITAAERDAAEIVRKAEDDAKKRTADSLAQEKNRVSAHKAELSLKLRELTDEYKNQIKEPESKKHGEIQNECDRLKKEYRSKSEAAKKAVYEAFAG